MVAWVVKIVATLTWRVRQTMRPMPAIHSWNCATMYAVPFTCFSNCSQHTHTHFGTHIGTHNSYCRNLLYCCSFWLACLQMNTLLSAVSMKSLLQMFQWTLWNAVFGLFLNSLCCLILICNVLFRSVQLLEIEPSPLLELGCGTVCQQTLLRVTHFLSPAENLKHFMDMLRRLINCRIIIIISV